MKLDQIHEMWEQDGKIDIVGISEDSANTPNLHNKYFNMYTREGLKLKKLRADYKKLKLIKTEYYKGQLDDEEIKQQGWPPLQLKIMNQDIPIYLEADQDIIDISLKIGVQEAIVEYLESILHQIRNRNWITRNIIEWEKFKTGAI